MTELWYKKYTKLPSYEFTYVNSGKNRCEVPPYNVKYNKDLDNVESIHGEWGMDQMWKIIGYSEQLPFQTSYDAIGIMFENQITFEKIWWHYPIY